MSDRKLLDPTTYVWFFGGKKWILNLTEGKMKHKTRFKVFILTWSVIRIERVMAFRNWTELCTIWTLKMEASNFFETSVIDYQSTRCHIREHFSVRIEFFFRVECTVRWYTFRNVERSKWCLPWRFVSHILISMISVGLFLTLYAPCIILQYVYKPTRCTVFLWLDFIFH